uniref:LYR motif containing 1 n=1 Tax=Molossus molossus TaxID=27622 RepID=A0A7J8J0D2_MOLMO|nr:LYR motif containing 1 [Molossus molossus]
MEERELAKALSRWRRADWKGPARRPVAGTECPGAFRWKGARVGCGGAVAQWRGLVKQPLAQDFPSSALVGLRMTTATRQEVLGLYRRISRLARTWQAASGQVEDTIAEKQYIVNEARTLFRRNKHIHLPPMGLTPLRGRGLRSQEKLRKLSQPVYLKSHDELS